MIVTGGRDLHTSTGAEASDEDIFNSGIPACSGDVCGLSGTCEQTKKQAVVFIGVQDIFLRT